MKMPSPPRRPLLVGTAAALVALLAAIGVAAAVGRDTADDRPVDATRHFTPSDQDPTGQGLVGRDTDGDAVPTTQFTKITKGLGSLADYRGTPLVVNFFGSWCVPCRKETPALESVHQALGTKVAFLGIAVHDSQKSAKAFIEEHSVTYDIGLDPSDALFSGMGAVNVPSTYFVSADGHIVAQHGGALTAAKLRSLLASKLHVS